MCERLSIFSPGDLSDDHVLTRNTNIVLEPVYMYTYRII